MIHYILNIFHDLNDILNIYKMFMCKGIYKMYRHIERLAVQESGGHMLLLEMFKYYS